MERSVHQIKCSLILCMLFACLFAADAVKAYSDDYIYLNADHNLYILNNNGTDGWRNDKSLTLDDVHHVTFNNAVTKINPISFSYCKNIATLTIPSTVKTIELGAFYGCTGLLSLTIREGVKVIGQNAFQHIAIRSISLPSTIISVEASAFKDTELERIEFKGETPPWIDAMAFNAKKTGTIVYPAGASGYTDGWKKSIGLSNWTLVSNSGVADYRKPYVIHTDESETAYDTFDAALNAAVSGESVVVPNNAEFSGDIVVPTGVALIVNGNLHNAPDSAGRLVISENASFCDTSSQSITILSNTNTALYADDNRTAYFTQLALSGKMSLSGTITLRDAKVSGDGMISMTGSGKATLSGESTFGKIGLDKGCVITLSDGFKASSVAAAVYIGKNYYPGRKLLAFGGDDQGRFAQYFKLGDAPDDSWYIAENGILTCKTDSDVCKILLETPAFGRGKKVSAKNLLPPLFKGGVTWSCDNGNVLKITGSGQNKMLSPVHIGVAMLTATFTSGKTMSVPVTVIEAKRAATSIAVKNGISLRVGAKEALNAKVKPATAIDRTLLWSSSDTSIASVDQAGRVTGIAKGKCKIYALTTAGTRKTINVTVKAAK